MDRRCEVRQWHHDPDCELCKAVFDGDCPSCRTGCFSAAKFRNPLHDGDGTGLGIYNYAEWLCAEHYDEVMDYIRRSKDNDLRDWEQNILDDRETDWDGEEEVTGA